MYARWVLTALLVWPAVAAVAILIAPPRWAKHLGFVASLIEFAIAVPLWWTFVPSGGMQFVCDAPWIQVPLFGTGAPWSIHYTVGGDSRLYSAIRFFIYTMFGSLLMLVAILALVYLAGQRTGIFSFDYFHLMRNLGDLGPLAFWLFAAFFLAFAIKVPMFPFHTWLPDAHVEAPTAGSVILAGILLKMGTYGFLRFAVPFFPAVALAPPVATAIVALSLVGILFAALLTFVSLSSIGLPGTNGFVGEFLVLVGAFRTHPVAAGIAATGVIVAAAYLLWALQRVIFNPLDKPENEKLLDLTPRELAVLLPLVACIVWIGVYPKPILDRMEPAARH